MPKVYRPKCADCGVVNDRTDINKSRCPKCYFAMLRRKKKEREDAAGRAAALAEMGWWV